MEKTQCLRHCNHLNTGLLWDSNVRIVSACQMVRIFKWWLKNQTDKSLFMVQNVSAKSHDLTFWKPDTHTVQYSDGRCSCFQENDVSSDTNGDGKARRTAAMDVEKVHSTIKAIVRDWSGEGSSERQMSYDPILQRLETIFQGRRKQDVKVSVTSKLWRITRTRIVIQKKLWNRPLFEVKYPVE